MFCLRDLMTITLPASGAIALHACPAETSGDDASSASASSPIRDDGKEQGATNLAKLSCQAHGFLGLDTVVDLGAVNRTDKNCGQTW
jgi:hypothetical protein